MAAVGLAPVLEAVSMDRELQARFGDIDAELRRARWWLLALGAFYFVVQLIASNRPTYAHAKEIIFAIGLGLLLVYGGLWWFAMKKPRLCFGAGLIVLWGAHIADAVASGGSPYRSILPKLIFTAGFLHGLACASRAEDLRAQLANVFD
jgi:hypothetical protein